MTWEQRYRLRQYLRSSLVVWAGPALVAAVLISPAVRYLDEATGRRIFSYGPDGARALLGALAGSMLTFIVFVLSATLIVVQLASAQLTPRIIGIVFELPRVKVTLGLYTFTFGYTIAALARIDERVLEFHVGLAVILNLACIVGFFFFVEQLSTALRPTALMRFVADRGQRVIEQVYPVRADAACRESASEMASLSGTSAVIEYDGRSGAVLAFSAAELVRIARSANAVVELVPQVGDFLAHGDPLFRIAPRERIACAAALRGCVAVGGERTLEQDPRFVFRILVDMACKALSPAINDPTTAVLAIDRIHDLLLTLGRRHLDSGTATDREGTVRLQYGTPNWSDYVVLAVSEIRHFGEDSLQVIRRLRAMLEHLIEVLPEQRRGPLHDELVLLSRAVARHFPDQEDRQRAAIGDYQGFGGSDQ